MSVAADHADVDDRRAVLLELVDRVLGEYANRPTITVEQAAQALGVGRSAAYASVTRGEIPSIRVARRVLIPVPALAALLLGASNGSRNPRPKTAIPASVETKRAEALR